MTRKRTGWLLPNVSALVGHLEISRCSIPTFRCQPCNFRDFSGGSIFSEVEPRSGHVTAGSASWYAILILSGNVWVFSWRQNDVIMCHFIGVLILAISCNDQCVNFSVTFHLLKWINKSLIIHANVISKWHMSRSRNCHSFRHLDVELTQDLSTESSDESARGQLESPDGSTESSDVSYESAMSQKCVSQVKNPVQEWWYEKGVLDTLEMRSFWGHFLDHFLTQMCHFDNPLLQRLTGNFSSKCVIFANPQNGHFLVTFLTYFWTSVWTSRSVISEGRTLQMCHFRWLDLQNRHFGGSLGSKNPVQGWLLPKGVSRGQNIVKFGSFSDPPGWGPNMPLFVGLTGVFSFKLGSLFDPKSCPGQESGLAPPKSSSGEVWRSILSKNRVLAGPTGS